MLNKTAIHETTVEYIVNSVTAFAEGRKKREAKFQILDLIMPYERKIRSLVGGLETSFGTTLWEGLAKELALQNGFTVCDKTNFLKPEYFHKDSETIFREVLDDREHERGKFDSYSSHEAIKAACSYYIKNVPNNWIAPPSGHGIDVWLKKDGIDYWFDIKTVQPNVGSYQRFLKQILNWYTFYYSRWPENHLEARIVFPYNPYAPKDYWDETPRGGLPIEHGSEAWVADDFWDFCTGNTGSTEIIFSSFKEIRQKGLLTGVLEDLFK